MMKSELMIAAPRSSTAEQLRAFITAYKSIAVDDEGIDAEVEIAEWRLSQIVDLVAS